MAEIKRNGKFISFYIAFFSRNIESIQSRTDFLFSVAQARANSLVGNVMDLHQGYYDNDDIINIIMSKYSIIESLCLDSKTFTFRKYPTSD